MRPSIPVAMNMIELQPGLPSTPNASTLIPGPHKTLGPKRDVGTMNVAAKRRETAMTREERFSLTRH